MSTSVVGKKKKKGGKSQQKIAAEQGSQQFAQPPPPAEKIDDKLLLHAALKLTSATGIFYDTKFYAFSRRKPDGLVYAPKEVYANGWLLRTRLPSYFEQLLSDTYGDCITSDLNGGYPASHQAHTADYDYDSDSDLEDDQDDDDWSDLRSLETSGHVGSGTQASSSQAQSEEKVVDTAESSSTGELKKDAQSAERDAKIAGRIVVLPHIAYATWDALIFYLCTGEVAFNRLKSQEELLPPPMPANSSSSPPPCSPKSMYRIADRLGLDELKTKAKQDIISKLSSDNILDELFSSFTATYEEIREAEVDFACQDAGRRRETMTRIPKWIDNFAAGDLHRSAGVLIRLFQKTAEGSALPSQCRHCSNTNISWRCNYCNNYM